MEPSCEHLESNKVQESCSHKEEIPKPILHFTLESMYAFNYLQSVSELDQSEFENRFTDAMCKKWQSEFLKAIPVPDKLGLEHEQACLKILDEKCKAFFSEISPIIKEHRSKTPDGSDDKLSHYLLNVLRCFSSAKDVLKFSHESQNCPTTIEEGKP